MTVTLPVPPSANKWWRNVNGRMVTSAEARQYKHNVPLHLWRQCGKPPRPLTGPVRITIRWYRSKGIGDLDKRVGILLDALQGAAYENDSQVVELHAYRVDGEAPRVEVTVEAA